MQMYLQIERGLVVLGGETFAPHQPRLLDDGEQLALSPDSSCAILLGTELASSPELVLFCRADDDGYWDPTAGVLVGEPVARFRFKSPQPGLPEAAVLECYFPENCSLRRLCAPSEGGPVYELQTPEGAVRFATTLFQPEPLVTKA